MIAPIAPWLSEAASGPGGPDGVLATLLHSALVQNLGWALLHFVWQGALIGCGTALLLALLRNARPQTRYAVACASLLLCLLLPLARLMLVDGSMASVLPGMSSASAGLGSLVPGAAGLPVATAGPAGSAGSEVTSAPAAWAAMVPWLVPLWMLGLGLFSARMLLGLLWLRRLHRQAPVAGADGLQALQVRWQQKIARMAGGFGLTRSVTLRLVDELDSPVTAGWWRPVIFVPASLISGMPPDFLEALLAHELAHVKRFDYVVNLIQSAIEMLLFYHPAVWWISRQIRLEREQIADDLAAARLGDTRRLALALQQLDLFQSSINQFAPAANGGVLMSRIKRLIRPEARSLNWKISLPLGGLLLVCSALYSTVQADVAKQGGSGAAPATPATEVTPVTPLTPVTPVTPLTPVTPATPLTPITSVTQVTPATSAAAARPGPPPAPPAMSAAKPARMNVPVPPQVAEAAEDLPSIDTVPPVPPVPPGPPPAKNGRAVRVHPAPPAPPAAPGAPAPLAREHKAGPRYALVSASGGTLSGNGVTPQQQAKARQLQAETGKDVLVFEQKGKAFVVTDPALVAKALASRQDAEKLEAKMAGLEAQMAQESKNLEKISASLAGAGNHGTTQAMEAAAEKLGANMAAIGSKQGQIGAEMGRIGVAMAGAGSDEERTRLREQMKQLRSQMEPLRAEMEEARKAMQAEMTRLNVDLAPLRKLGEEMREKSRPLRELGRQMGRLGGERARLERESSRTIGDIIEKSLADGAAKEL